MNKLLTVLFSTLLLSACDYVYNYSYVLTNNSGGRLSVRVLTRDIDTVYTVAENETKTLFTTIHDTEGPKGPHYQDVSFDLDSFIVIKNDSLFSTRNYIDSAAWQFDKGVYSTTVEAGEF